MDMTEMNDCPSFQPKKKTLWGRNATWLSVSLNHRSYALYQQSCDSGFLGNKIVLLSWFPEALAPALWDVSSCHRTSNLSVWSLFPHCALITHPTEPGFLFLLSCRYHTICSYSFHWRDFSSYSSQSDSVWTSLAERLDAVSEKW